MELNHLINIKSSGTILAASRYTINKILSLIPFDQDLTLLEIGLGDGCITSEIISKMSQNSKLVGLEINQKFYEDIKVRISDNRVILIHESVINLTRILEEINLNKIDVIISTLPLSYFSKSEQELIFNQISSHMTDKSIFIQAVHLPNVLSLLKKYFKTIESMLELRNLPPYIIYRCGKE